MKKHSILTCKVPLVQLKGHDFLEICMQSSTNFVDLYQFCSIRALPEYFMEAFFPILISVPLDFKFVPLIVVVPVAP